MCRHRFLLCTYLVYSFLVCAFNYVFSHIYVVGPRLRLQFNFEVILSPFLKGSLSTPEIRGSNPVIGKLFVHNIHFDQL